MGQHTIMKWMKVKLIINRKSESRKSRKKNNTSEVATILTGFFSQSLPLLLISDFVRSLDEGHLTSFLLSRDPAIFVSNANDKSV